jgi:N-acetylneuraminic acid mutarotase
LTGRALAATGALLAALSISVSPALAAGAAGWRATGETSTEHSGHTATRLYDGTVLVVGGSEFNSQAAGAVELYDPAGNRWSALPSTAVKRTGHSAVRLDDGRVLVLGGFSLSGNSRLPVAAAELFDPRSLTWSSAAPMLLARAHPVVVLLGDGRVLVAGGGTGGESVTAEAELYDPAANRWTPTGSMAAPRIDASALRLRTGRVLVAGGTAVAANQESSLTSAETYDPTSGSWAPAGVMSSAHAAAPIGMLPNGSVLIAGGTDYQGGYGIGTTAADVYDPEINRWRETTRLHYPRGDSGGDLLADGTFLVVGGMGRTGSFSENSAELYDPATRTWTLEPRLPETRVGATVTALAGGGALVVGGTRLQVAEVFMPPPRLKPARATLEGAVADNLPLVGVTALLLLAVLGQLAWRARPQAGGGR